MNENLQNGLIGIGQDIVGTGMGLLLEKHNDRRQINQQQKLTDMQLAANKQMTDYSYQKQIQMWNDTNYSAQMQQMERAGLNPALLYGMSGGGGTTTGTGASSSGGAASAPQGGQEILGMLQTKSQLNLQSAQAEALKATAAKDNAIAQKTAGVDTQKTTIETKSITQGIENQKTIAQLNRIQYKINQQDYDFSSSSFADRLDIIQQEAKMYTGQATQAMIQGNVDEETRQTKQNMIKTQYVGQILQNALTEIQTKSGEQGIKESQQRIMQSAATIVQTFQSLDQNQQKIKLQQIMQEYITKPSWNKIWNSLQTVVGDAVKETIK